MNPILKLTLNSDAWRIPRASGAELRAGLAAAAGGWARGKAAFAGGAARAFATGPAASATQVSDELLAKLKTLSTQALVDGQWVLGWPPCHIEGARPLGPGMKMAGRAVTMRFVPQRPDIQADKPPAGDSPEYEAFEMCGPNEVLVMSSVGPWESVGGDIKFLRLQQRNIAGLVTDGSIRDTDTLLGYGFPCYSYSTTPRQGPAVMQPWEANCVTTCGGVVVRPGDAIVGDQDGVVVVPAAIAEKVYEIAHSRETIEEVIKEQLIEEKCPPGKYYPFMSGKIKPESPLGKLLDSKGVKYMHTAAAAGPAGAARGAARRAAGGPAFGARGAAARARFSSAAARARGFAAAAALDHMQTKEQEAAVLAYIKEHKATAVLRTNDEEFAPKAMDAAIEGGFKILEFTLTTPGCLKMVKDYSPRDDVLVGCGTVMTVEQAEAAMAAGAKFLVSPCIIPEVIEWAVARNIVIVPGCQTPSELFAAYRMGAQIQKLFPGIAGGANTVKAITAALPMLTVNPTSGVEKDTAAAFLQNGASSLGFVAPLFPPALMGARDYDGLVKNAKEIIANVKAA
eukprot:PRCOL_00006709-RA